MIDWSRCRESANALQVAPVTRELKFSSRLYNEGWTCMKEATFKFEVVDDLLISFQTAGPAPDGMWDEFVKQLKKPEVKKFLGTTMGAAEVNSVQRKNAANVFKVRKIPVVIVTESSLVRGLVTAVSWLGADVKAFDWVDLRKGLNYLNVGGSQQEQAVETTVRLKATYAR